MYEKRIQLLQVWCGNGTYNDMRDLRTDNSSSSKLLDNPPRPYTGIMRHTMHGVLRNFTDWENEMK
jgi:hypothetical protein